MSDANIDVLPARARVVMPPYRELRRQRPAPTGAGHAAAYPVRRLDYIAPDRRGSVVHVTTADRGVSAPRPLPLPGPAGWYAGLGKRLLDIALIVFAAPVALLLIAVAAVLLWIEGGSPFYRQARLGRKGETFQILKLRTMVRDADRKLEAYLAADPKMRAEWDRTQKLRHDPRITPTGHFLRKTSLDELPQLWNVLRGDMSLVGPRPMLPEQLPLYGDAAHYFALRPGITGYWQVSQRNESAFAARTALDMAYLYDVSFAEDARILWRTVGAVVNRTGM